MVVIVVVAVLAALAVGLVLLERQVVRAAHDRTIARLESLVGGTVQVVLHGRPLALHLQRRWLPAVEVVATDVPVPGRAARIARVEVQLTGVHLPHDGRRGEDARPLSADDARFVAWITETDLIALVALPAGIRIIRITPRGIRLAGSVPGVRVDASLRIRGGSLVIRPEPRLLALVPGAELLRTEFLVPLPVLPAGGRVEDLRIEDGVIVCSGPLEGDWLAPPTDPHGPRELDRPRLPYWSYHLTSAARRRTVRRRQPEVPRATPADRTAQPDRRGVRPARRGHRRG